MIQYKLENILLALQKLDYKIYEKPYMLNIVGIRSTEEANKFDDTMCVFWKDDAGVWNFRQYPCTTDTGTYYLLKPMSSLGSAMLKEGQYINAYSLGKHKKKYPALVQSKQVCAYRSIDRKALYVFREESIKCGLYGMNIHKAGINSENVNNWSAGCQVFKKTADFDEFIALCKKQDKLYGNNAFTYTLLDTRTNSYA